MIARHNLSIRETLRQRGKAALEVMGYQARSLSRTRQHEFPWLIVGGRAQSFVGTRGLADLGMADEEDARLAAGRAGEAVRRRRIKNREDGLGRDSRGDWWYVGGLGRRRATEQVSDTAAPWIVYGVVLAPGMFGTVACPRLLSHLESWPAAVDASFDTPGGWPR
jgi:hypothetical protein